MASLSGAFVMVGTEHTREAAKLLVSPAIDNTCCLYDGTRGVAKILPPYSWGLPTSWQLGLGSLLSTGDDGRTLLMISSVAACKDVQGSMGRACLFDNPTAAST